MKGFPTSADIYLELDGRKIAVVQSYRAKAAKSSKNIEAFGESEPVATIEGQKSYTVELTRLYATDTAISDGIDFYNLTDFSLVICKPDRKVIYSGCEWSGIQEDGELNATVAERVTLTAPGASRLPHEDSGRSEAADSGEVAGAVAVLSGEGGRSAGTDAAVQRRHSAG